MSYVLLNNVPFDFSTAFYQCTYAEPWTEWKIEFLLSFSPFFTHSRNKILRLYFVLTLFLQTTKLEHPNFTPFFTIHVTKFRYFFSFFYDTRPLFEKTTFSIRSGTISKTETNILTPFVPFV